MNLPERFYGRLKTVNGLSAEMMAKDLVKDSMNPYAFAFVALAVPKDKELHTKCILIHTNLASINDAKELFKFASDIREGS